jgi:hydroxyacylglutathione hydrolase
MTEILALHAFDDNYIWLLRANGCVAVVDPGDAAPVLAHLAQSGDRLCAILATHHHGDHIGGLGELTSRFPVPVFGPALENISGVSHALSGGERIKLPEIGVDLEVIAVPGHTRGHLAYYGPSIDDVGAVFCGDTLFGAGCGRLFEGTPAQMHESLAKLAALPAQTLRLLRPRIHPEQPALRRRRGTRQRRRAAPQRTCSRRTRRGTCHDADDASASNSTPIPSCAGMNPRSAAPAASAARPRDPADAVETFAAIREWKNRF